MIIATIIFLLIIAIIIKMLYDGYFFIINTREAIQIKYKEDNDSTYTIILVNNLNRTINNIFIYINGNYITYIDKFDDDKEIIINKDIIKSKKDKYKMLIEIKNNISIKKNCFIEIPMQYKISIKLDPDLLNLPTNLLIEEYLITLNGNSNDMNWLKNKILETIFTQMVTVIVAIITATTISDSESAFSIMSNGILLPAIVLLLIFFITYFNNLKKDEIENCDCDKEIVRLRKIKSKIKRKYKITDNEFNEYIKKFK